MGRQGALYQKCTGWLEAATRIIQAWCIGGILCHIDDGAWEGLDFGLWLSAVKSSRLPRLYASPGLMPFYPPPESAYPLMEPHALRGVHWQPMEWRLYDAGQSTTPAEQTPPLLPLAPQPLRARAMSTAPLGPSLSRVPPHSPSPFPFASSSSARQSPALSAVGGFHPDATRCQAPSIPFLPARRPSEPPTLQTVHGGRAPWVYLTE